MSRATWEKLREAVGAPASAIIRIDGPDRQRFCFWSVFYNPPPDTAMTMEIAEGREANFADVWVVPFDGSAPFLDAMETRPIKWVPKLRYSDGLVYLEGQDV